MAKNDEIAKEAEKAIVWLTLKPNSGIVKIEEMIKKHGINFEYAHLQIHLKRHENIILLDSLFGVTSIRHLINIYPEFNKKHQLS